ncbi:MAG: class I SAM-dependent methyltransferase [Dehalococcoidia bacterium]|nr:class I SAM-dependent methyltransferase [Dehalococcoidia bacterium]
MDMGLQHGLLEEVNRHPQGVATEALARQCGLDPFYVQMWYRAAYASDFLEVGAGQTYRLAPFVDRLLLDKGFPGYMGGMPAIITSPEIFDRFAEKLPSGERTWWNQCSPTFIQAVGGTGWPFYTRIITTGFSKVPGLVELLNAGARVLELACGVGTGLARIAQAYPSATFVGVDGDAYSLQLTRRQPGPGRGPRPGVPGAEHPGGH